MKLGPLQAMNICVPLSAMLTVPSPDRFPMYVALHDESSRYSSLPDTTYPYSPIRHSPRMGPLPTVASRRRPGARFRNAGSFPPSGTPSGNRLTMRESAALTLRATYDPPRIGVFMLRCSSEDIEPLATDHDGIGDAHEVIRTILTLEIALRYRGDLRHGSRWVNPELSRNLTGKVVSEGAEIAWREGQLGRKGRGLRQLLH